MIRWLAVLFKIHMHLLFHSLSKMRLINLLLKMCCHHWVVKFFWHFCALVLKWKGLLNYSHVTLVNNIQSADNFLTGPVSFTVFCTYCILGILYSISSNPMHSLSLPYELVRIIRGALVARRYSYALPHRTFIDHSVSQSQIRLVVWNSVQKIIFILVQKTCR